MGTPATVDGARPTMSPSSIPSSSWTSLWNGASLQPSTVYSQLSTQHSIPSKRQLGQSNFHKGQDKPFGSKMMALQLKTTKTCEKQKRPYRLDQKNFFYSPLFQQGVDSMDKNT